MATGDNAEVPDSRVNLHAIRSLAPARAGANGKAPSYANGGIQSWQTALHSTIRVVRGLPSDGRTAGTTGNVCRSKRAFTMTGDDRGKYPALSRSEADGIRCARSAFR